MGTTAIRPYVEVDDAFRDSVLLVNAPMTLYGTCMAEGSWSVLTNLRLDVVRWDGTVTVAERQRRAAGNHAAVLYFFDPTERTRVEAEERLHPVLGHVLDTTAATTRIYACMYGVSMKDDTKGPAVQFDPRDTIISLAKARGPNAGVRERIKVRYLYEEPAWVQLQTEISLVLLPRKMGKPLFNLAKDMATATDATDVLLLNSHSLLPVLAYSTTEVPIQARACQIIKPLKECLAPYLQRNQGARLRAFEVECEPGLICCRVAVHNDVLMVMVIPFQGDDTATTGAALARVNMTHYAEHFSNVIRNTTERRSFNPILPPDDG